MNFNLGVFESELPLQLLLMAALWCQCLSTVAHYLEGDEIKLNESKLKLFEKKTVPSTTRDCSMMPMIWEKNCTMHYSWLFYDANDLRK